jgi:hypothetical protein
MSLCSYIYIYIYIYNKAGSHPGLPGSAGFRVDSPGQFPGCFLLKPGPALDPGQPGPGSTRRAGPGFKTMVAAAEMVVATRVINK